MELILVRHGRPVRHEVTDGARPDPGLGPPGHEQATALAEWLAPEPVDAIYASPLERARQTAEPLAGHRGLTVAIDADLEEVSIGESAYIPFEELGDGEREAHLDRWRTALTGGADNPVIRELRERTLGAADRIATAHPGSSVAVFCHGGVINAMLTGVLGLTELFVFEVAYTSITRLRVSSSGRRSVISVNETPHLRSVRTPAH